MAPPADVVEIDPRAPDPAVLARAGAVIRRGGLVAFPTETVYGLGANALDDAAVARIYAAKGRDAADPLIVHLASANDLSRVARTPSATAAAIARRFWPGPLTLVLERDPAVPARVSAGRATVAVRVPDHAIARGLIEASGVPVAAPSANRFMRTSATTAAHVVADLGDAVDLILDGGPTAIGVESTVVAFDEDGAPRVLRPGAVPVEAIAEAMRAAGIDVGVRVGPASPGATGGTFTDGADPDRQVGEVSPGSMALHYAPRATLRLVAAGPGAVARMVAEARAAIAAGRRVGVLLLAEDWPELVRVPGLELAPLGAASDPPEVARRLFAAMRALDARGVAMIVARTLGPVGGGPVPVASASGLSRAIDDRLVRAAGSQVLR